MQVYWYDCHSRVGTFHKQQKRVWRHLQGCDDWVLVVVDISLRNTCDNNYKLKKSYEENLAQNVSSKNYELVL